MVPLKHYHKLNKINVKFLEEKKKRNLTNSADVIDRSHTQVEIFPFRFFSLTVFLEMMESIFLAKDFPKNHVFL